MKNLTASDFNDKLSDIPNYRRNEMKIKIVTLASLVFLGAASGLYAENKPGKDHPMDKDHPRFKAMDTNSDGKISKDEWLAKFTEMDVDKNGTISEVEMKNHHEIMQKKMQEHMHEHMKMDGKKGK